MTFWKNTSVAAAVMLAPLHAAFVLLYFAALFAGLASHWLVDSLSYALPVLLLLAVLFLPGAVLRRSRLLVACVALPLVAFTVIYGKDFVPRSPVSNGTPEFTVMSYNVWGGNRQHDRILAAILDEAPHILNLQELTDEIALGVLEPLSEVYPYQVVDDGQGIFSQYPIENYMIHLLGDDTEPITVQQADLNIEGHTVSIINVHTHTPWLVGSPVFGLPLGIPKGFVTKWRDWEVRELLELLDSMSGPVVVVGDLNLTDRQVVYAEIMARLADAHSEAGHGLGLTRTPVRWTEIPLWRIDYVLHTPDLTAIDFSQGDFGGSDHRPVVARLQIAASETGVFNSPVEDE